MRFLIVKERNSTKRINVDRIINIQSFKDKVLIHYEFGNEVRTVEIETGHPNELADYIMNMVINGGKIIDIRDMDKVKFIKASEMVEKSKLILA